MKFNAGIDHLAPVGLRRGNTNAKEAERRLQHHGKRDGQHEAHDDRRDEVGDQVLPNDVAGGRAEGLGGAYTSGQTCTHPNRAATSTMVKNPPPVSAP